MTTPGSLVAIGYLGAGNAGDEWLLEAIGSVASGAGLEIETAISAPKYLQRVVARIRQIRQADCAVFVGGAVVKDSTVQGGASGALLFIEPLIGLAFGTPLIAVGLGRGTIRDEAGRRALGRALRAIPAVWARDTRTHAFFRDELNVPQARLGTDTTFLLPVPTVADPTPGSIGLSLSTSEVLQQLTDVSAVRDAVREALSDQCPSHLYAFQRQQGADDFELARSAVADDSEAVQHDLSAMEWSESVSALAVPEQFVASRYHACLVRKRLGLHVTSIGHDFKLVDLFDDFSKSTEAEFQERASAMEASFRDVLSRAKPVPRAIRARALVAVLLISAQVLGEKLTREVRRLLGLRS